MIAPATQALIEVRRRFRLRGCALAVVVEVDVIQQGQIRWRGSLRIPATPGQHRVRMWFDHRFKWTRVVEVATDKPSVVKASFTTARDRRRRQRRLADSDGLHGPTWAAVYDVVVAAHDGEDERLVRMWKRLERSRVNRSLCFQYLWLLNFVTIRDRLQQSATPELLDPLIREARPRWDQLLRAPDHLLRDTAYMVSHVITAHEGTTRGVDLRAMTALLVCLIANPAEHLDALRPTLARAMTANPILAKPPTPAATAETP